MYSTRDITALIIYLVIIALLNIWITRTGKEERLRKNLLYTGGFLILYFLVIEIQERTFYLALPVGFYLLFHFFYFRDKAKLRNGWLFNLFLISLFAYLGVLSFTSTSLITIGILFVLGVFGILVLIFGFYALIIFLLWNSYLVFKRESHSLANLLTLILALGVIVASIIRRFGTQFVPSWSAPLLLIPTAILIYLFIVFWNFLSISLIYQLNDPKPDQDYVIVLGAGLIQGERVSPLLAKRIDRAIAFYQKQSRKTLSPPQLLMSGGQGPDEKVPESVAMKNYALEQGIPEDEILIETHSTTTLENMRFSKDIMEREKPAGYRAIFASNNYHIFRAGMYAEQVGLKADGIGAKTAKYYLPNAFLREFAALLVMNKRIHIIMGALITSASVGLALLQLFIDWYIR
ncbi:YdcF family protein [Enterococcus sp. AZ072]|uniref:YdcF family protein n=1 Tax=unclassified Enterococcus TaxID=2608891 RepID=UPI003D2C501F